MDMMLVVSSALNHDLTAEYFCPPNTGLYGNENVAVRTSYIIADSSLHTTAVIRVCTPDRT